MAQLYSAVSTRQNESQLNNQQSRNRVEIDSSPPSSSEGLEPGPLVSREGSETLQDSSESYVPRTTSSRESWNSYQPHIRSYWGSRSEVLSLTETLDPRSGITPSTDFSHSSSIGGGKGFALPARPALAQWESGPEPDDWLHDPKDAYNHGSFVSKGFPVRALWNIGTLGLLVLALIGLFLGYPVIVEIRRRAGTFNPVLNPTQNVDLSELGLFSLIDPDTPSEFLTKVGVDGEELQLVFSDEFNVEGRSFYPGDDPFWEADSMWYWGTGNYEWYDPAAVTTSDGHLTIVLSEQPTHNLNFQGGFVSSWNKLCVTGGLIEASIQLPGYSDHGGLWPAFWMMGNLARAGFGATTEGLWPYSYESCDVGTLANQTGYDGIPTTNLEVYNPFNAAYNTTALSWLPGQRLSACTCPGEDHPGPILADGSFKGRSGPEIDFVEGQVGRSYADRRNQVMQVSQSFQAAPFNDKYILSNQSEPGFEIFNNSRTQHNSYLGAAFQQAISFVSDTPREATEKGNKGGARGGQFAVYGGEYTPGPEGTATWISDDVPAWKLNAAGLDPDPVSLIGRRPMAAEPMYIIFNLGISPNFGNIEFNEITFPNTMKVDWVRVWQPKDKINIGCSPDDYPTFDYINRHWDAYHNSDLTRWGTAGGAGYNATWPKNRLYGGCDVPETTTPGGPNPIPQAPWYDPEALRALF